MAGRLLFRGPMFLGTEAPVVVDLWASDTAVVAFEGGTERGRLSALTVGLEGPPSDRRLRLSGLDADGTPVHWLGAEPAHLTGVWHNAKIAWPEGIGWNQAEVTWTQYGVKVATVGQDARELPAARTEAIGAQHWIVNGSERIPANTSRNCGCGG